MSYNVSKIACIFSNLTHDKKISFFYYMEWYTQFDCLICDRPQVSKEKLCITIFSAW